MDRRTFLAGTGAVLLAAPLAAEAQQAGKVYRVGWLGDTFPGAATPVVETFRQGLRDGGYVEGHNLVIEFRGGDGKADQLREHAAEFARLKIDAILAVGTAARAAVAVTKTIPIVFMLVTDPIGAGLVGSFARPGGNVTGVTTLYDEAFGKYLELLREILPGLSRVGLVLEPSVPPAESLFRKLESVAKVARVTLQRGEIRRPEDFDATFSRMARQGVQAVIVWPGRLVFLYKETIAVQALRHRLPTLTVVEAPVRAGLMIAYQPSYPEMFRRAGVLVGRILKGASPADLPVEQPRRFQLIINLKTAKALGLTIPPSVLGRADEVVQ